MRQFSPPHLAALAVLVLGIAASVPAARRWPGRWTVWFARGLAVVIFVGWAGEYLYDALQGTWTVRFTLPLQLTDLISLTAILALWTLRQGAIELVYFWAFSATLQAVVTPDLGQSFPNILCFTYFIYHVGAMIGAAFLVFGLRRWPRPGTMWRAFGATLAWACVAGLADVITGGNYMYLAWKPAHGSLLSVLGPWPWYIAGAAAIGLAMLWLLKEVTDGLRHVVG
jgi:hypothetical integral membrane protein (TIGR02206 family)